MKKNKNRRFICVLITVLACTLCFVLQWGGYTWLKQREARFVSPINEENSLIRLQAAHKIEAPIVFIGSSVTERLLPRKSSASVAMSHSSFVYVNEFMETRYQYKPGTVYVLEVNNMFNNRNIELTERTNQWDFDLFRDSSHFSFAAKPANLLVSFVFYFLEHMKHETDAQYTDIPAPIVNMDAVPDITEEQKKEWAHLIEGIEVLKSRGGRICFVNHPCLKTSLFFKANYKRGCILAKYMDIPVLNYNSPEWVERLEFTDPIHLNSRRKSTVMYMNTAANSAALIAVD